MISPLCKEILSKVSRKIYEIEELGNVVIQCISLYQTNKKYSFLLSLVCFLLLRELQCSHNFAHGNYHK